MNDHLNIDSSTSQDIKKENIKNYCAKREFEDWSHLIFQLCDYTMETFIYLYFYSRIAKKYILPAKKIKSFSSYIFLNLKIFFTQVDIFLNFENYIFGLNYPIKYPLKCENTIFQYLFCENNI